MQEVSISCQPITSEANNISRSDKEYKLQSRLMCQKRLHDWYVTGQWRLFTPLRHLIQPFHMLEDHVALHSILYFVFAFWIVITFYTFFHIAILYEAHQTYLFAREGCIGKLDRCNNCRICKTLSVNETVETLVKSTYFSIDYLKLKMYRMQNKPIHIESAAGIKASYDIVIYKYGKLIMQKLK
jgi:hypothetical protein